MRKLIFIFVLILSIGFTSFIGGLNEWWFSGKGFDGRLRYVHNHFQKGIVLPFFALEDNYPYKQAIDEIRDLRAGSISFFVTNYMEDIRSNYIYINRRAVEVNQLSEMVDYAHRRGLTVFLFPTLHIQHLGDKEWRGVMEPKDWEVWWANYSRLIRMYTDFAREHDVEMLSVGSELCSTEWDYKHWSSIIRYARSHYSGVLTYSANWDHYHDIRFMKDLDYMGINAYFGLTQKTNPKLDELLKSWEPARKRIQEAYDEYKKPLIFTEIGYPSVDGANWKPWNYFSTLPLDLDEQAMCYEAFVRTWNHPPSYLHGVYFYNWWGPGGPQDRDYTPRDKPAARILARWYATLW